VHAAEPITLLNVPAAHSTHGPVPFGPEYPALHWNTPCSVAYFGRHALPFTKKRSGQHASIVLEPTGAANPFQHAVQFSLPTTLLYEPAAHGKHWCFFRSAKKKKYPAMHWHAKTLALPMADTEFAGHPLHAVRASVEYVSAGQSAHALESVALLYLPPAHAAHVLRSD